MNNAHHLGAYGQGPPSPGHAYLLGQSNDEDELLRSPNNHKKQQRLTTETKSGKAKGPAFAKEPTVAERLAEEAYQKQLAKEKNVQLDIDAEEDALLAQAKSSNQHVDKIPGHATNKSNAPYMHELNNPARGMFDTLGADEVPSPTS